ncbi:MAG: glutathione binding-like protein [Myxococcota bacterium]
MKLYFSPLACSLATRMAIYDAGLSAEFIEVNRETKQLADGGDYRDVHPLGTVPALLVDDVLITEMPAVLQYISDRDPRSRDLSATELRRWLSFVGSELHKGIFAPLFDSKASPAAQAYAIERGKTRLAFIDRHMTGRDYLLDVKSVADMYLHTALNWTLPTPIALEDYPGLHAFHQSFRKLPFVARAFSEERPLYLAQQAANAGITAPEAP